MTFKPRLTAPTTDNRFYYKDNVFYKSGYGMPNCTCYAWGRFYELLNKPLVTFVVDGWKFIS